MSGVIMPRGVTVDVQVERRPAKTAGKLKITRKYTLDLTDCTIGDILTTLVAIREEDHVAEHTPIKFDFVGKKARFESNETVTDPYAKYNVGKEHLEG